MSSTPAIPTPARARLFALLSGAAVLASSPLAAQSVVYRETFANGTGAQIRISEVGWATWNSAGVNITGGGNTWIAESANGIVTNPLTVNVNAGPYNVSTPASGPTAIGFFAINQTTTPSLVLTREYQQQNISTLQSVSYYMGNTGLDNHFRVILEVGGNWFVSTKVDTHSIANGGAFQGSAALKTLTIGDANSTWNSLTFTAGEPVTIGSTIVTLPTSGLITGFGLYSQTNNTGFARFDNFTLTAIPEPSAFAALAGLGALGLAATRRR